jgi:hypothetical protein
MQIMRDLITPIIWPKNCNPTKIYCDVLLYKNRNKKLNFQPSVTFSFFNIINLELPTNFSQFFSLEGRQSVKAQGKFHWRHDAKIYPIPTKVIVISAPLFKNHNLITEDRVNLRIETNLFIVE